MKRSKYLLPFLIVISFAQSACKKGETPKTTTDYLTQKPWALVGKQTRVGSASGSADWYDAFKDLPPCSVDDIYTYTAGGQYVKGEGPTKCSASDAQTVTDNWTFETGTNGTQYIRFASWGSQQVLQLDDNTLVIAYISAISGTYSLTNKLTFAHP